MAATIPNARHARRRRQGSSASLPSAKHSSSADAPDRTTVVSRHPWFSRPYWECRDVRWSLLGPARATGWREGAGALGAIRSVAHAATTRVHLICPFISHDRWQSRAGQNQGVSVVEIEARLDFNDTDPLIGFPSADLRLDAHRRRFRVENRVDAMERRAQVQLRRFVTRLANRPFDLVLERRELTTEM